MPDVSERELVKQAQQGSQQALGQLYDRHQEDIYRFIAARTGDAQTAQDLTGEVFARMVERLHGYRAGQVPFRAWLYRIARNLVTDHVRREAAGSRAAVKIAPLEAHGDPVEPVVFHNMALEAAAHGLANLDDNPRDVIILRFIIGMTLDETAETLGLTTASVKAHQHRGLKTLRAVLKGEIDGRT